MNFRKTSENTVEDDIFTYCVTIEVVRKVKGGVDEVTKRFISWKQFEDCMPGVAGAMKGERK